jgi:hypothetical protein
MCNDSHFFKINLFDARFYVRSYFSTGAITIVLRVILSRDVFILDSSLDIIELINNWLFETSVQLNIYCYYTTKSAVVIKVSTLSAQFFMSSVRSRIYQKLYLELCLMDLDITNVTQLYSDIEKPSLFDLSSYIWLFITY